MYVLNICNTPEVMEVMNFIKLLIKAIMVIVPIMIIVITSIEITKIIADPDPNVSKQFKKIFVSRVIACVAIMFFPSFINILLNITGSGYGYEECITLATTENIVELYLTRAEELVSKAEKSLNNSDVALAQIALNDVKDEISKENLSKRLDVVRESIKKIQEEEEKKRQEEEEQKKQETTPTIEVGPGTSSSSSSSSSSSGTCKKNIALTYEPTPSDPLTCYPNILNLDNFVFPVDSNKRKLGAYPKNYNSLPSQLKNYKTYKGEFIIPVTPVNSKYNFVYNHNGIDFMAYFGTPIYSPVDGTLYYSEWGHTGNTGGDETAYSLSITMDRPVTINGKQISTIFLTHMSGIRYRCSIGKCNRKVKKGELLGFVGNAAGSATTGGWAPHLHMSIYPAGKYDQGLRTKEIEELYNLTSGMTLNAGG